VVESLEIKEKFIQLLNLVKIEASSNFSILAYYNYLNEYEEKFIEESNYLNKQDLRIFLIGANRYSDEFNFSDQHSSQIRELTNNLFELLSNEKST